MDHLVQDCDEIVEDGRLLRWRQPVPDGVGGDGHNPSIGSISVTNSVTAARVSLLTGPCREGAKSVAATGIRSRIGSR